MVGICPVCKKPANERVKPFCSQRCADVDLGRWLGETYKVATNEAPDEVENPAQNHTEPSESEE